MRSLAVTIALIETALASSLLAQRTGCQETTTPKQLPSVNALLDSAGAINALGTIDAPDGMLFSLVFFEDDSLPLVRPLYGTAPAAALILAKAIRPQKRSKLWGIRVRVAQGPVPALRLERASYCPPVLISESIPRVVTQTVRIEVSDPSRIPQPRSLRFEVLVTGEGEAKLVNVTESSGYREIDDQAIQTWRQARFHPALLDGLPVGGWFRSDGKPPRL